MLGGGWLTAADNAKTEEHGVQERKQSMATAEGERVLEVWATAFASHDMEGFLALYTEDCIYEAVPFGAVNHGKAALRAWVEHTFASTPDFTVTVTTRFAVGNWAAMEWVMSGTHSGDYPGIPATGKRYAAIRGATVVELQGGKIHRSSHYWDAATLMKQVGLLPT